MEITITDSDIEKAEKFFLSNGEKFDNERKTFIKCVDKSFHLQACPGSGKTTALLAKLYILSEKMPFENNRGICVLTHTNVAIDLIKKKLGERANKLLSYPNFFGTIQSFVDKYLAIPAYIKYFRYRPKFIDNDFFYNRLTKYNSQFSNNNWLKNNKGSYESVLDYVFQIEIDFLNNNDNELFKLKEFKLKNKSSATYRNLYTAFKKLFEDGYLRFSDAFSLAKLYLSNLNRLSDIFSSRFKFVFIDEAQDTNKIQREIIEKCFNKDVIIQWIGDVNQSIMNDNFSESAWQPEKNDRYVVMNLTKSHRISQPIADFIGQIAIKSENNLQGKDTPIKPKLLIFNGQEEKVLEKFADLVSQTKCNYDNKQLSIYEISKQTGNPIKAVGWVGKKRDNGLSIKSFFPNFEKKLTNNRRIYFPNLFTMCQLSKNVTPKDFQDRLLNCILEALHISNINSLQGKRFSKTEFLNFIRNKDENLLNNFLAEIASFYKNGVFSTLSNAVIGLLGGLSININETSRNYLTEQKNEEVNKQISGNEFNVYKKNDIEIYINTVHGVKGETHTATLYLETKFYENSLSYIFNKTGKDKTSTDREGSAKKIAYVAFSRPTHLLCVAIHENEYKKSDKSIINFFDVDDSLIKTHT